MSEAVSVPDVGSISVWLIPSLEALFPELKFEGKFFDVGVQYGVAGTIFIDGKRKRAAFRAPVLECDRPELYKDFVIRSANLFFLKWLSGL